MFEARIDPGTTWARDFLAAHAAGLVRGLSPGFRVAPGGERIERRGNGLLRRITAGELFELSAVTVPAYPAAQIEARNWRAGAEPHDAGLCRALHRWRA
jgi:HK97 family phage prohead protease